MYLSLLAHARAWASGVAIVIGAMLLPCLVPCLVLCLAAPAAGQTLTLSEALARARDADPALSAAAARIDAARATADQAERRPNPSLSLTGENLLGTRTGFDRTETTLAYNQLLERGGKREARVSLAGSELEVARLRQTVALLDIYQAVEAAWVDVVAADAQVHLATERLAVADRLKDETRRRVAAALDPAFAGARVDTLSTQAQIALGRARAAADRARAALASYWGGDPAFQVDARSLEAISAVPPAPDEPIDLALVNAQRRIASSRVALEEARSVQDPTFHVGVRHFNNNNELGVVAGVSIPLALFDSNRGGVARARAEQRAADEDIRAARVAWDREYVQLGARLDSYAAEARRLGSETIPGAETTLRLVREAFGRGAFSYIEVTEAERTLADARARRLDVLRLYHLDKARLNRLLGVHANGPGKIKLIEEPQP